MSSAINVTDGTFQREVLDETGLVLVDFWAPWCGPCRALGPTLDEIARQYEGTVKVVKVNVDENPRLSGDFGINSIPTVLVFRGGSQVETLIGLQPRQRYEDVLREVAA